MNHNRFQILVSTMNQNDISLVERMNIHSSTIVVNQTSTPDKVDLSSIYPEVCWINKNEKGLSKSRNVALSNAIGEICLLADDDEIFCDNCEKIIIDAFEKYKDADIIAFQVTGIERPFKTYSPIPKRLNFFSAMKTSSVQIAIKTDSFKTKGIKFDERFGAGSQYIMGEENIMLADAIRAGLKLYYVPEKIADLHLGASSWNNAFDEKYFISRGAQYYRMSSFFSPVLILYFSIHIYFKHKSEFKLCDAIRWMFKGLRECKM